MKGVMVVRVIGIVFLVGLLTACAKDVNVAYPHPQPEAAHGSVMIKFTGPIRQVHVQLDGSLIVEDEHTERVTIDRVPAGERDVEIAASESKKSEAVHVRRTVVVRPGRTTTVLVATPPMSTGAWAYMAALAAVYLVSLESR